MPTTLLVEIATLGCVGSYLEPNSVHEGVAKALVRNLNSEIDSQSPPSA